MISTASVIFFEFLLAHCRLTGSRRTLSVNMSGCNVSLHIFVDLKRTLDQILSSGWRGGHFECQLPLPLPAVVIVQSMMNTVKVEKPDITIPGMDTLGVIASYCSETGPSAARHILMSNVSRARTIRNFFRFF